MRAHHTAPDVREALRTAPGPADGPNASDGLYRDAGQNLRTQLERIIRRAGLEPWPKLFQNLRSTRETELAESFPMHVVCEWIGNSAAVAAKHYLQVTDEHFEQAAQSEAKCHARSRRPKRQTPVLPGDA
ncbi:MAG: hypothetical protein AB7O59_21705 [Pirellulales bacterium]